MSVKTVKYDNVTDPRLGRHVEHDERSRAYPYRAAPETAVVSRRWKREVPTFDQGNLGSCTGNASVGCVGTDPFWGTVQSVLAQKSLLLNEKEAVAVYSAATAIDDIQGTYPPDDTGSSGLAVAKIVQGLGLISGYKHIFSFTDLQAALQDGPVIVGTNWYNGMFTPDKDGYLVIAANDSIAGGHEYIIDEIDVENKRFGMQNSWGDSWGINGRAYISFDTMKRLLSEDGDGTVFVPLTAPAPQPEPVPTPPAPSPTPSPVPPTPVPSDADASLWDSVKSWASKRHYGDSKFVANHLVAWAKDKGYTR